MDALLGILVFLLLIALVIGLIKPKLIMFWSKNPKRLKVFGWWALSTFLIILIAVLLDTDKSKLNKAQEDIEQGNYEYAIYKLGLISEDSELFYEADSLLNYAKEQLDIKIEKEVAESLKAEENERLAQLEDEKAKMEENKTQKIEQLKKEIKSIDNGVDFSTYRGTVDLVQMELVLLGAWTNIIEEALEYDDPEVKRLANILKTKVQNLQVKEFPKLRKAYKEAIYKNLWLEDIETAILGNGYTTIQFTGAIFANNKNKQETQDMLNEILHMLRFKRVNYKWYEYDDEYTYYTLKTPSDKELVKFE